ncbi:hypothetical protein DRP53_05445 [candidate division WOR-3 bacterium]|uniref:Leucine-binding protein domain-containing protein n=1 Tax=candidate division WOR-3 bacterium TaxID=2052148 RepID=A0A660SJP7_UNCW3|nr:MAG: hypothetical protein DRP53_05445 [candidate division WOR-3 bacterium]
MRNLIILLLISGCIRTYIAVPESDRSVEEALKHYKEGDYQSALDLIRSYLNRYPSAYNRDDALKIGAVCAYELGDFGLAIRYSKEIIRRFPHSEHHSHAQLIYGLAKVSLGNGEEGVIALIQVIQRSGNEKERQKAMGMVDSLLPHLSIPSLQKIHRQNVGLPIDEWILFHLARKEVEEKRYDEAKRHLTRYLELFPSGEHSDSIETLLRIAGMGGSTGKIGLLIPLTGRFKDYGGDAQEGFFSEFGDTHRVIIGDTSSDPIEAFLQAKQMVRRKVDLIVGPIFAVEALPVAGLVSGHAIPLILPTESDPRFSRLPEEVISLSNEMITDTRLIAEFAMKGLGLKRLAVLHPQTPQGEFLTRIFTNEVLQRDGEIVTVVPFPPDSLTLKWELLEIKRHRPDGIFLPVDPKQLVMICTQLKYHELLNLKILTVGTAVTDLVIRLGEEYVEGIYFARPVEEPKDTSFVRAKFAQAARIVKTSLATARDRKELLQTLRSLVQFEEGIFTIRNGEIKPVEG